MNAIHMVNLDPSIEESRKAEKAALYANGAGLVTTLTIMSDYSSQSVDISYISIWFFTVGLICGGINLFLFPILQDMWHIDISRMEIFEEKSDLLKITKCVEALSDRVKTYRDSSDELNDPVGEELSAMLMDAELKLERIGKYISKRGEYIDRLEDVQRRHQDIYETKIFTHNSGKVKTENLTFDHMVRIWASTYSYFQVLSPICFVVGLLWGVASL